LVKKGNLVVFEVDRSYSTERVSIKFLIYNDKAMQINWSKTREQFPLSSKKIIKKTIASTVAVVIGLLAILIIIIVILGSFGLSAAGSSAQGAFAFLGFAVIAILLLIFVVVLLTYLYQQWYFAVYFYELDNDYIVIKKGPITPREITIPYERIQDVYVDQDLLDRMFGLYDVHLSSATVSSGMEAHIDGVEKQAADGLRAILLETVKKRISRHGGPDVVQNS
jgi:membrane protein YdbS with pleckstrin-like domain